MNLNTKAERMIAVWSGHTLVNQYRNKVYEGKGNLYFQASDSADATYLTTALDGGMGSVWKIHKEPEWWEKPNLCRIKNHLDRKWSCSIVQVVGYISDDFYPFITQGGSYKYCEQLTKPEIQEYLNNAPEGEVK